EFVRRTSPRFCGTFSSTNTAVAPESARRIAFILHLCVSSTVLEPTAYLSNVVNCAPSSATCTASRLAGSFALAFSLMRWRLPGGSKKAFTGLVDFDRLGRGIFGTDRPREYISDDASGVMMWT